MFYKVADHTMMEVEMGNESNGKMFFEDLILLDKNFQNTNQFFDFTFPILESGGYSHLVCNTLKQALFRRHFPKNVLIHSDQGSQYCSADFKQLLLQYELRQSMSRRGNCFDNAVVESFFHTLKTHIIHDCYYKTRKQASKALFEYIEIYYNRIRRHSANG
ncbi:DDE-type integrase/transposase/recombinase [Gilliamella sp. Lep-s21]|nr:DDE-type integrase/transposase/recombinase [Gilliamella sp. Lep-s35]MWP68653.1 DDE-type integrase/transposase/recombinase [Gilliamella sp. Lep-s5]MWP76679.1 DDE-type integrase/transposase/recombinase [Gilliamella sp. Lep-s21]